MESNVAKAKRDYASALKRLESISYEIHERRNLHHNHTDKRDRSNSSELEPRVEAIGAEQVTSMSDSLNSLNINSPRSTHGSRVTSPQVVTPSRTAINALSNWFYKSTNSIADSDRESIASGDTVDTLDDATIEKLMLEPTLGECRDIFDDK